MPAWKAIVAKYQKPAAGRAIWQLLNTLVPYAALWYLIYLSLKVSWWLAIPLAVLVGGFAVRLFIISHDCGHGSFFKSRAANTVFGVLTGVITFVPYHHWRWEHAQHHATSGDLDRFLRIGIKSEKDTLGEYVLTSPPRPARPSETDSCLPRNVSMPLAAG